MRLGESFPYRGMLDSYTTTVKSTRHQNKDKTLFHSLKILVLLKRVITGVKLFRFLEALLLVRPGILFVRWSFAVSAEHMTGKLVDLEV